MEDQIPTRRRRCNPGELPCIPYTAPFYTSAMGVVKVVGRTDRGKPWVMTFPYAAASTISKPNADAIVSRWATVVVPLLRIALNVGYKILQIYFTSNDQGGSTRSTYDFPGGVSGTANGEALPANVAYAVRRATNGTGGVVRGRIYMPGLSENTSNGNTQAPPYLAAVAQFTDAVLDTNLATGGAVKLAVISKSKRAAAAVTSFGGNGLSDSQRRRAKPN